MQGCANLGNPHPSPLPEGRALRPCADAVAPEGTEPSPAATLPRQRFVLKTDVKSYDASIDPQLVLDRLAVHITDQAILRLIGQYLRCCAERGGLLWDDTQGLAFGSPLRPLLGALFLTEVDAALERLGLFAVRSMDDLLVLVPTRWKLRQAVKVVHQGRIVQIGTTHEVYRHPANAFVADFIGKANFVSAHVLGVSPGRVDLDVLGRPLSICAPDSVPRIGERVTLLARPEAILLDGSGDGYPGRVCRTAYLGPIVEYDIDVAGTLLTLTQYDPRQVHPVGSDVHVQLVQEAIYLLPQESQ